MTILPIEIYVDTDTVRMPKKVDAELIPPFAIHPTFNGEGYTLTHMPTGLAVMAEHESYEKLKKLAEVLARDSDWLLLTEDVYKNITVEIKRKYTNKLQGCKRAAGFY